MDVGKPHGTDDVVFDVPAVGACVTSTQIVTDPRVCALLVDSGCWDLYFADWRSRRPPLWRRRNSTAWIAEGYGLLCERHGLESRARQCGLRSPR